MPSTLLSGCTMLAAMTSGGVEPMEEKPFGIRQVSGSWQW